MSNKKKSNTPVENNRISLDAIIEDVVAKLPAKREAIQGRIELGDTVRDAVTGAEGIAITLSQHLTGCDTVTIELGLSSEGKAPLLALDYTRLEITERGTISKEKLPAFKAAAAQATAPAAG